MTQTRWLTSWVIQYGRSRTQSLICPGGRQWRLHIDVASTCGCLSTGMFKRQTLSLYNCLVCWKGVLWVMRAWEWGAPKGWVKSRRRNVGIRLCMTSADLHQGKRGGRLYAGSWRLLKNVAMMYQDGFYIRIRFDILGCQICNGKEYTVKQNCWGNWILNLMSSHPPQNAINKQCKWHSLS